MHAISHRQHCFSIPTDRLLMVLLTHLLFEPFSLSDVDDPPSKHLFGHQALSNLESMSRTLRLWTITFQMMDCSSKSSCACLAAAVSQPRYCWLRCWHVTSCAGYGLKADQRGVSEAAVCKAAGLTQQSLRVPGHERRLQQTG